MFEKLLELLLATKTGAISGVLFLAGALVTVTSGNGVTTITLEQATPTPTVTATATPTATPVPTRTATASPVPTLTPSPTSTTPTSCAADAQARADARQRVRDAFVQDHAALTALRGGGHGRMSEALSQADTMLKEIAKTADETLRGLECTEAKQHEDENDGSEDEDADERSTASPSPTPTPTASSGVSAATQISDVADRAVAAMDTVLNAARSLAAHATASPSPVHHDGHDGHKDGGHD